MIYRIIFDSESFDIEEAYFLWWVLVTDLALEFAWFAIDGNKNAEFSNIGRVMLLEVFNEYAVTTLRSILLPEYILHWLI